MGCERYNNYGHGELLSWVEGNDVFLKARVYEKVVTEQDSSSSEGDEPAGNAAGTVEERAVDLTAFDDVEVELVKVSLGTRTDIETTIDQTEDNCLVVHCPYTLESGEYALEIRLMKDGLRARSFDIQFAVVQTDCEAQTTFEVIDGCRSASLRVTLQVVSQALVRGKSAYELWKELPGNEDKTLQDFIDEMLELNAITAAAREATDAANTAASGAGNVNAVLNGNTLTVTDRNGVSTTTNVKGDKGDTGVGVPVGGSTGQVLAKKSGSDYDTEWVNQSGGGYEPPVGGIPKTDLAADVQASLGKADTALQSFTESDPTVPQWAKQPNKPSYTAQEVGALSNSTKYGSTIDLAMNSTTYVLTLSLKDQDGTVLNTKTVDLPIESVVVNGRYDSVNKKIVLTLQSGSTIDVPVGDLIAGLQTEITSVNMLDADLVDDTNSTHKFVTAQEKQAWNNKSDFSGSYNDLSDKPTIPDAQIQSDWNQSNSSAKDFIKNKPTIPDVTNYVQKSQTAGLLKNDGSVDTNTYLTQHQDISGKQDKIDATHKLSADLVADGQSNKSYTAAEKEKLAGIAAGAEVNVQANWNESNTSSDAYIQNKPGNLAYIDSTQGSATTASFDPQTDTVWTKTQTLSVASKTTARNNIGAQEALVSGTNIKTINNESLLGSGNISVAAELPSNLAYTSNDNGEGVIPQDGIRAVTVTSAATMTINPDVVTVIDGAVGTAAITLQVPQDNLAHVWDILLTTDSSVAITFAMSNSATILYPDGFAVGASKAVEVSVIGVGTKYYLRYGQFA